MTEPQDAISHTVSVSAIEHKIAPLFSGKEPLQLGVERPSDRLSIACSFIPVLPHLPDPHFKRAKSSDCGQQLSMGKDAPKRRAAKGGSGGGVEKNHREEFRLLESLRSPSSPWATSQSHCTATS